MSDSTHNLVIPRASVSSETRQRLEGHRTALVFALLGAGVVLLLFVTPWNVALVVALAILILSAIENETFLLFVLWLMPIGWMAPRNMPIRNMHVVFHILVVAGFFAGRMWRNRADLGQLFRPMVSRASLLFLCAAVAPTLLIGGALTHDSMRADCDLLAFVGFYFVILAWVNSRRRLRQVLWAILFSTVVTCLFAIYQEIIGGFSTLWFYLYPEGDDSFRGWEGRASSFLAAPNSLAVYLDLILPFALACWILCRGKWKNLGAWTLGLGVVALLSTQGIGGLLAFVATLVLGILWFARSLKKKLLLLGGLATLALLFYVLGPVLNPVHTRGAVEEDAVTRLLLWGAAANLFIQSPVIGVGWGNFADLYTSEAPSIPGALAAHNLYFQLLAEIGLVGFVAFLYLILKAWRQAWNQLRFSADPLNLALAFGTLGALLSVMVQGLTDFPFQTNAQFGTLFWVLLALMVVNGRLQAKAENGPVPSSGASQGSKVSA
jgi:putative inorganic carbon (hco3(-)) transporter